MTQGAAIFLGAMVGVGLWLGVRVLIQAARETLHESDRDID